MNPPALNHSRRCKGGRIEQRPALTRPGWTVYQCDCCRAVAVVPDPEPATLDFEDGSP